MKRRRKPYDSQGVLALAYAVMHGTTPEQAVRFAGLKATKPKPERRKP